MALNSNSLGFGTYLVKCESDAVAASVAKCFTTSTSTKYDVMAVGSDVRLYQVGATAVCRIGTQEYLMLQEAIDAVAENGTATIQIIADIKQDTAVVIDGNRKITITDDGTARTITREESMTAARLFRVNEGSSLTLTGTSKSDETPMLTVDGNKEAIRANLGADAQIAYVAAGGSMTVEAGVVLKDNLAKNVGAAITVYGTLTVNGGSFENNETTSANGGGALNVENGGAIYINGGTFKENKATASGGAKGGGALRVVYGGTAVVKNALFTGNSSTGHGGAIYTMDDSGKAAASLTVENCSFTENTAGSDAGAIFVNPMQNVVTVKNSTFTGNSAGAYGGAMEAKSNGGVKLYSCTFTDNTSVSGGAAVTVPTGYTVYLEDCTATHTGEAKNGDVRLGGSDSVAQLAGKNVIDTIYLAHNSGSYVQTVGTLSEGSQIGLTPVAQAGVTVVKCTDDAQAESLLAAGYFTLNITGFELEANGSTLRLKTAEDGGDDGDDENEDPVARIRETGETYATLEAALNAANSMTSATVELLADVELTYSMTISGNVSIVDDGTARTIKRSSSWISGSSPTYNRMFYIAEGASLNLSGSSGSDDAVMLNVDGGSLAAKSNGQIIAVGNVT